MSLFFKNNHRTLILNILVLFLMAIVTLGNPVVIHLTQQNFAMHFHQSFEQQKRLLITPIYTQGRNTKHTTPYQSFFILFYNSLVEESLQTRQLYHQFYTEYHSKLIDLLRKRGAKNFADFQYGVSNSIQIAEIDCQQSVKMCQFFKVQIVPTFIYLTGGNQEDDMTKKHRQVYLYTSWISSQQMLYFTMKAYAHKIIDLSRVAKLQMKVLNHPYRPRSIRSFVTMRTIIITCSSVSLSVAITSFLIFRMLKKNRILKQMHQIKQTQTEKDKQKPLQQKQELQQKKTQTQNTQKKHTYKKKKN